MQAVSEWFNINNLALNAKKTKCINFCPPNVKENNININLNNNVLDLVDNTIFLGLTLDKRLQWGPHIEVLSSRLSSAAYAVWKIRGVTDIDTARTVYFSYFHSLMTYGLLLWGHAADANSIFILQKRAIRAIYKLRRRDSLRELFKETNILTFYSQYIYDNIMYTRKNINNLPKNCDNHNINLRNKNKIEVPRFRLSRIKSSFMGNSIRFYNKLPENVLNLTNTKFKRLIKETLVKKAYYSIDDYMNDKDIWCASSST